MKVIKKTPPPRWRHRARPDPERAAAIMLEAAHKMATRWERWALQTLQFPVLNGFATTEEAHAAAERVRAGRLVMVLTARQMRDAVGLLGLVEVIGGVLWEDAAGTLYTTHA